MGLSEDQSSKLEAYRRLTEELRMNGMLEQASQDVSFQRHPTPVSTSTTGSAVSRSMQKNNRSPISKDKFHKAKSSRAAERVQKVFSPASKFPLQANYSRSTSTTRSQNPDSSARSRLNGYSSAQKVTSGPTSARSTQNYGNTRTAPSGRTVDGPRRFVVGLDYGTTFTSVSYFVHALDDNNPIAFPSDIRSIINWPFDGIGGTRNQVPTESWYSTVPMKRQSEPYQFDEDGSEDEEEFSEPEASRNPPNMNALLDMETNAKYQDESAMDTDESPSYLWGYEVPHQRYRANSTRNPKRHIERPKLMLIKPSSYTEGDRKRLRPCLDALIDDGIIRKYGDRHEPRVRDIQDVVTDFLIRIFHHTKKQLIEHENFTEDCPVSLVLTTPVPSIWGPRASRVMQCAMEEAMVTTGFGTMKHGSVDNLFIIPEPEAAATYLVSNSREIMAGETFVLLDCGGGTVDAVTYTVTNGYPLRLASEVVKPEGDNCGASYLNENYEQRLLDRLKDEHYLDHHGKSREQIVRRLIPDFENHEKRYKDIAKRPSLRLIIDGLRGDTRKGFEDDTLLLNKRDYEEIFVPLLGRVRHLLRKQLEGAIEKGKEVKKVFLIGGFGAALSMHSYLKQFLADFSTDSKLPYDIELKITDEQKSVIAVASGAVMRALNKAGGPTREAYSSYGFLRVEPFQPKLEPGHRGAKPFKDEVDGELYIRAIDYFMTKKTKIDPIQQFEPFKCYHAFDRDEYEGYPLLCEEVLYVHDQATESHYPIDHPRNKGAQVAGKIIVDMSFLRDENLIWPTFAVPDENKNPQGKTHWRVDYDLVPIVEGRNLRYEARYPANSSGKTLKTGQVGIAAAFKPGTD